RENHHQRGRNDQLDEGETVRRAVKELRAERPTGEDGCEGDDRYVGYDGYNEPSGAGHRFSENKMTSASSFLVPIVPVVPVVPLVPHLIVTADPCVCT